MSRKSNLPPETLELYKRVFETYLQEIKADPDYSFAEHCAKWDVKASSLNARLCREGIFISRLKQESRDRLAEESFRQAQRRGGPSYPCIPKARRCPAGGTPRSPASRSAFPGRSA